MLDKYEVLLVISTMIFCAAFVLISALVQEVFARLIFKMVMSGLLFAICALIYAIWLKWIKKKYRNK
jgi:membrane protein DedA with SNARE-associated domain